jgi:hypothetical protein
MARKKITFTCEEELWKEFRKKALDKNVDYSYYIEELIKKELKK